MLLIVNSMTLINLHANSHVNLYNPTEMSAWKLKKCAVPIKLSCCYIIITVRAYGACLQSVVYRAC